MPGTIDTLIPSMATTPRHLAEDKSGNADLRLALSPYFLVTREAPAMAALLLGSRILTLLPEPREGDTRDTVTSALKHSPGYLRLLEAWRWSAPLWRAGVLGAVESGATCAAAVPDVYSRISSTPGLEPLRPLTRHIEETDRSDRSQPPPARTDAADEASHAGANQCLQAFTSDLLRGGPDPGINIPITAALDRFALEQNLIPVRGSMDSVAQRAEQRLSRRLFSIAIPLLSRAGGTTLLGAREDLAEPLADLRAELTRAFERAGQRTASASERPTPARAEDSAALASSATDFTRAFDSWSADNIPGDDEDGTRLTSAYFSITGAEVPADAVLLAGRAALSAMHGQTTTTASRDPIAPVPGPSTLRLLVVKELNVRPA